MLLLCSSPRMIFIYLKAKKQSCGEEESFESANFCRSPIPFRKGTEAFGYGIYHGGPVFQTTLEGDPLLDHRTNRVPLCNPCIQGCGPLTNLLTSQTARVTGAHGLIHDAKASFWSFNSIRSTPCTTFSELALPQSLMTIFRCSKRPGPGVL